MPRSLILVLNELQHLEPDQIVSNLSDRGWVQGKDFTLEHIERWRNRLTRVWFNPGLNRPVQAGECGLFDFSWDYPGVTRTLPSYWFILEEFFNGEYPS